MRQTIKTALPVQFTTIALATVSLGALTACGALGAKGPHVPARYQGTTTVTLANAWDHELCVFAISATAEVDDNWLGDAGNRQSLPPGTRRTFDIKPGTYHVVGGFCEGGHAIAAGGTYGDATVNLNGPSLISFGPKQTEPVAGAETIPFTELRDTRN
jgi:hypothetical protein